MSSFRVCCRVSRGHCNKINIFILYRRAKE